MRRICFVLVVFVCTALILGSCASNNVVSSSFIQKRKYNKGWFIKRNGNTKDHEVSADNHAPEYRSLDKLEERTETRTVQRNAAHLVSPKRRANSVLNEHVSNPQEKTKSIYYTNSGQNFTSTIPGAVSFRRNGTIPAKMDVPQKNLQESKREPLGIIGLVLGALTILALIVVLGNLLEIVPLIVLALITGSISLTLGILSLIRIKRKEEYYKGKGIALLSMAAGALLLFFGGFLAFLLVAFN